MQWPIELDPFSTGLAVTAVLLIGISKAGFGGSLGMLSTPLCVIGFGARDALGILLPLLCAGDAFSLYPYWGKWQRKNLLYLLPGIIIGVLIGVLLIARIDQISPRGLNLVIGSLAVIFVLFQVIKERILAAEGTFKPNHRIGAPFGIATGVTSTFAHGAGPVVTMFLVPQRLPKQIFVGTMVLIFTWVNWIKVPFYFGTGLITLQTLKISLCFLPLIPIGVGIGVWLNRKFTESSFLWVIYVLTFLAGIKLIFNLDLTALFSR